MPMLLVLVFHFARIVLPELVQGQDILPFAVDPAVEVTFEGSTTVGREHPTTSASTATEANDTGGATDAESMHENGDEPGGSDGADERER